MKTLHQIREDLRAIRFYYEKKSDLERGAKHIGESAVVQLVENTMPPFVTLPSAYMICTYVFTSIITRKPSLRRTKNARPNIRRLHKQLCEYLQQAVGKEESESA